MVEGNSYKYWDPGLGKKGKKTILKNPKQPGATKQEEQGQQLTCTTGTMMLSKSHPKQSDCNPFCTDYSCLCFLKLIEVGWFILQPVNRAMTT